MKRVDRLQDVEFQKDSVVTVGTFDGVHLGHRQILDEVASRARTRGGRSVVVTFEPHPREVLGQGPVELLTTLEERQRHCELAGIDLFVVVPFTFEFSRQASREFLFNYLVKTIGVSGIVEGFDHHFGKDREGSVEELIALGKEFDFSVVVLKPVTLDGEIVSSSRIRAYLREGNVERAARLLGRPYELTGTVVRGDGRGKSLGYPTANLTLLSQKKLVPKDGIYFTTAFVEGKSYAAMTSIGVRPTFGSNGHRIVEVNLLDFDGDLYGQHVTIRFIKRLRDEMKFESPEALVQQMHRDREESEKLSRSMTI